MSEKTSALEVKLAKARKVLDELFEECHSGNISTHDGWSVTSPTFSLPSEVQAKVYEVQQEARADAESEPERVEASIEVAVLQQTVTKLEGELALERDRYHRLELRLKDEKARGDLLQKLVDAAHAKRVREE